MNWRRPLLLGAAVLVLAPPPGPLPDLDVGVPPGMPTSWGRSFPSITPRGGPLFPTTGGPRDATGGAAGKAAPDLPANRTVSGTRTAKLEVGIASSFGVVRILTWDLAQHLTWVARKPTPPRNGPTTGARRGAPVELPYVTDGLYWAGMAALLRHMLHPQLVSEKELVAHLVEIGEPLLEVLDNSVAEKALAPASREVRRRVDAPVGDAAPLPGSTPRETMLLRFLAEELSQTYPYDPSGGFGRRFFLFADEVRPLLLQYAEKHPGSFLRRNAVAAAGRYRDHETMRALGRIAATTGDPVVLLRALAAVGAYRSLADRRPLLDRLTSGKDPIERVALIVAAGRMGMREAVPFLLKIAERSRDPDTVQAIAAALLRIDHPPGDPRVVRFGQRMVRLIAKNPAVFRAEDHGGPRPDQPDGQGARGEVIHQLAWLLLARVADGAEREAARKQVLAFLGDPGEAERVRERGGRADPGPRGRKVPRSSRYYPNRSLGPVHPPVQMLFVETLAHLGPGGIAGLERIAGDRSVDPRVRGHALAHLPFSSRGTVAAAILAAASEPVETKIYAMETLAHDGAADLEKHARGLLDDCTRARPGVNRPELRYLWLQALQALDRRRLLQTADLLPLLGYPNARRPDGATLQERVRDEVTKLVAAVAAGLRPLATRRRIETLLDLLIATGVGGRVTAANREEKIGAVAARLRALAGHKADPLFQERVARDILTLLTGFAVGVSLQERTEFRPVVLLEEEILLALGRSGTAAAGDALVGFLRERPDSPLRAHAALALGLLGDLGRARQLVPLLLDPDGFVRFCAYESLRHLTGRDYQADWMYGGETERRTAARRYRKLLGS